MPKTISSFELTLNHRRPQQTLTQWLYEELRSAILEGRLGPGARPPPRETLRACIAFRAAQP